MSHVYDKAHELAKIFKESNEFKELKSLHEEVNKDDSANRMLENFRKLQMELQQKQMQGIQITEEEVMQAQRQFELVQQHEKLSKLMEAEQKVSVLIGDINKIITEPLEQLYGNQ